MRTNIQGIDHVVVLVRDLDQAAAAYARMGFQLTPRGFHTLGSQNHCIIFGDDYIELLAVPKPHPAMQYFTDFLAEGPGLGAIGLATGDAAGAHAELTASGITADPPFDLSRPVDDLGDARFRIVQLPPERSPGCRMFLCQHFTRELVWRKGFASHPLGATGIAGMAVVGAPSAGYESLLAERPQQIAEGVRLETGSAPLAVCDEARLARRLEGIALPQRKRPVVAALFIRVSDRSRAAAILKKGGFSPRTLADGSLALGANDAHGIALVFG